MTGLFHLAVVEHADTVYGELFGLPRRKPDVFHFRIAFAQCGPSGRAYLRELQIRADMPDTILCEARRTDHRERERSSDALCGSNHGFAPHSFEWIDVVEVVRRRAMHAAKSELIFCAASTIARCRPQMKYICSPSFSRHQIVPACGSAGPKSVSSFGHGSENVATVKFVYNSPGSAQSQRGFLITVGWPHYAHGGGVLSAPCDNVDDLRREVQQLKAQLDTALADGENFFSQVGE